MPHTNPYRSEPLLYTLPEAAAALRISRTKLYELLDSQEIESIHIGRSRKIPAEALWMYVEQLRARSAHRLTVASTTEEEG
ncbi:MAG TPA: helix-turn-helix domain-containing protein [Actinocrinis sp.]|nr:helix-turn-helix domain-containing protein [Actinocrinis sp.]